PWTSSLGAIAIELCGYPFGKARCVPVHLMRCGQTVVPHAIVTPEMDPLIGRLAEVAVWRCVSIDSSIVPDEMADVPVDQHCGNAIRWNNRLKVVKRRSPF